MKTVDAPLARSRGPKRVTALSCAVALAIGLGSPDRATSEGLPLGELPGGDSTLFTGTVVHRVPLELPSARAGLVPTLAEIANHQTGDGILGMGWALEGLSRIDRRGATYGVPTFDLDGTEDTFFVDGELLVSSHDGYYHPEHDDNRIFSKIYGMEDDLPVLGWQAKRDGWTWTWGIKETSSDPNDEFAVESWEESGCLSPYDGDHDGDVDLNDFLLFENCAAGPSISYPQGCAAKDYDGDRDVDIKDFAILQRRFTGRKLRAASVFAGPSNVTWLLSSVKDPHGNEITYTYDADCCSGLPTTVLTDGEYAYEHKIRQITYAGGHNKIYFDYEKRQDTRARASLGRLRLLDCRLAKIRAEVDSSGSLSSPASYSVYSFYYEDSTAGPLADLTLLNRIYRGSTTDAKIKLLRSMSYSSEVPSFLPEPAKSMDSTRLTPSDAMNYPQDTISPMVVNFDGDAWPDLAVLAMSNTACSVGAHVAYHNVGNTDAWSTGSSDFLVRDSALTDFLNSVITEDLLFTGDATNPCKIPFGAFLFLDLDRDGATELITSKGTDTKVYKYNHATGTYDEKTGWASVDYYYLQHAQVAEIDGDGFMDLIISPYEVTSPTHYSSPSTLWIRNSGAVPYLDDANLEVLVTPLEDSSSTASKELADKRAALKDPWSPPCNCDADYPLFRKPGACTAEGETYFSTDDYIAAQARWGDFNADGLAARGERLFRACSPFSSGDSDRTA